MVSSSNHQGDQERFRNITVEWDDAHRYSPAPRHRRRVVMNWLSRIHYQTCLDVGCAQPYLLLDLARAGKSAAGCDISEQVVAANRRQMPELEFAVVDVAKENYPGGKRFDLVIASEVLEHIEDWSSAVKHICAMSGKYVLITVPSGPLHGLDKLIGHYRHFAGPEMVRALEANGFRIVRRRHWGFPVHTVYKLLINRTAPEKIYQAFGSAKYGFFQKAVSQILNVLFYINDLFPAGRLFLVLAERA